jgi:hypothetical protein
MRHLARRLFHYSSPTCKTPGLARSCHEASTPSPRASSTPSRPSSSSIASGALAHSFELAIVEHVGWFHTGRLQALSDRARTDFEVLNAPTDTLINTTINR